MRRHDGVVLGWFDVIFRRRRKHIRLLAGEAGGFLEWFRFTVLLLVK